MPAAPGMMMRSSLLAVSRPLVAVTIKVTGGFGGGGNAIEPFCGMRCHARYKREDKDHGAKKGNPPLHQGRP